MTRKLFSLFFVLSCLLVQVRFVFACDVMESQLSICCCHEQAVMDCKKSSDCQSPKADACCEIDTSITAGTFTIAGDYIQVLDGNTVSVDLPHGFNPTQAIFDLPLPQNKPAPALQAHVDSAAGTQTYLKTLRLRI